MKIDPEFKSEVIRPLSTIFKGIVVIVLVALASGWMAPYIGRVPIIIVALIIALRSGLKILFIIGRHRKEDRDANPEFDLQRPWTLEELKKRQNENDYALRHGFVVMLCGMLVYAFLV